MAIDVAQQLDEAEADADAEERDEDRQSHRQHRTERDEQDHDGGEDADELRRAEPAVLLEHAPTERDADTAAVGVVGEVADALDGRVGDLRRHAVELDGRVRDVAVARDLAARPRRRTG